MKPVQTLLLAGALLAAAVPLGASAQMYQGSIPPEILQARDQAKTNAFNDLSADHRAKVQAIVANFNNGSIERDEAVKEIDAVLTPDESKAVLGEQQKLRDAMRQAFANNGGNGSFAGERRGGSERRSGQRQPDAGRFLLMLWADPNNDSSRPHPLTVQ
jgi:hypothetical protein